MISFSSASRQACGEPGSEKTSRPCTTPACARDIMAAAPTSWYESMRKSSPKPEMRLVSRDSTASKVESREVMPVPPVRMNTW